MKESDIIYEDGKYWVTIQTIKKTKFYIVWKTGLTHSTKRCTISESLGFDKVLEHIEYQKKWESKNG